MWLNLLADDRSPMWQHHNFFFEKTLAHKATNEAGLHDDNNDDELNSL